jgi:membrane protein
MAAPSDTPSGNRLDSWRGSRASRIAADIANYVVYAVKRFYRDQGAQAAGALTYTTLLALVPLLAIAFAIFSAFPAFEAVQDRIEAVLFENLVPEVGNEVRGYITSFTRNTTNLTAVGVIALGVSAVLLLATIESTFNRIWRVERDRPIVVRLLIFWTMITLGPLLLGASFSLTTDVFASLRTLASEGAQLVPIDLEGDGLGLFDATVAALLQTVAFTVMFMVVPARSVRLRDALIGGAISGIVFEVLKWGFRAYLTSFPTYQTIYGAMAVIPIFLIWLYLSWTVVLVGAVFAASFPEWWRSRDPTVGMELSPAHRLEAAIALLVVIAGRARSGGVVDAEALADAVPLDARDSVVEALRTRSYVAATDQDGFTLARDLRHTTVADLAHDLDLTLGLDVRDSADAEVAAKLDTKLGPVPTMLRDLGDAERRIMGLSLAEVIDAAIAERDGSGVIAIPVRAGAD